MSDAARIRALEDEIDTLREALVSAETLLAGGACVWPAVLGLTPGEGRVLGALTRGRALTREYARVMSSPHGVLTEVDSGSGVVMISKLRGKLRPRGISVRTVRAVGWVIEGENLAQVRAWAATGRIDARPEDIAPDAEAPRVAGVRV